MRRRELFSCGASYLAPQEHPPMRRRLGLGWNAWKYVEAPYARKAASGDVYVGTLQHFGKIENGRDDDIDGGYIISSGTLISGRRRDRAALNNIEPGLGDRANVAIVGSEFRRLLGGAYAICASKVGTPRVKPMGPEVLFEIVDMYAFAERIVQVGAERLRGFEVAEVEYCQRRFDAHDAAGNAYAREDAFYKETKHAHEREIRAAFDALPGAAFEPFSTGPDEFLASLVRPVPRKEWPFDHSHLRTLDEVDDELRTKA